jgi:hypothetical protein
MSRKSAGKAMRVETPRPVEVYRAGDVRAGALDEADGDRGRLVYAVRVTGCR